jgi:hypothetical protein
MQFTDDELKRFGEQMREWTRRRQQMRVALKAVITPILREGGFTGACPHFRRLAKERYDLLTFYFDKYGDSFVIDIGQCSTDWAHAAQRTPPNQKLNPWYLEAHQRARVQPGPYISNKGSWFHYNGADTPEDYRRVAESVVPFVEQALAMFDNYDHVRKIDEPEGT